MRVLKQTWLVLAVAAMASACVQKAQEGVVKGPKGSSDKATNAVIEVVLRDMLVNVPPGEEVYVSFGTSWPDRVDPPAGFLERLADIPATLRPVSDYGTEPTRTPLLLIAHIDSRQSDTEAKVKATRYRLGVGAADGFTARVVWSGGGWSVADRSATWAR